jgi:hypothetical protein
MDANAQIDSKPVPLLTTLLYRACDADHAKFETVLDALQDAFEAGQKRGDV